MDHRVLKSKLKKLNIPYSPFKKVEEERPTYSLATGEIKAISEYSGLSFFDINNVIDIDEYMLLLRDSYIYNARSTKEGKEYLEEAYAYEHIDANKVDEDLLAMAEEE